MFGQPTEILGAQNPLFVFAVPKGKEWGVLGKQFKDWWSILADIKRA